MERKGINRSNGAAWRPSLILRDKNSKSFIEIVERAPEFRREKSGNNSRGSECSQQYTNPPSLTCNPLGPAADFLSPTLIPPSKGVTRFNRPVATPMRAKPNRPPPKTTLINGATRETDIGWVAAGRNRQRVISCCRFNSACRRHLSAPFACFRLATYHRMLRGNSAISNGARVGLVMVTMH